MADFIPNNDGNLNSWLTNLSGKAVATGDLLGVSPEQIKLAIEKAQLLQTAITNANAAKAESRKANAAKKAQKKETLKVIRALAIVFKANPLWTEAIANDVQMVVPSVTVDPLTYKAKLSVKLDGGGVRLRISKRGVEAVNIYTRLQGETQWVLLEKVNRSTYSDKRKLKTQGVAEIREYQVRGVIADQEIGHVSDIVSISFGG